MGKIIKTLNILEILGVDTSSADLSGLQSDGVMGMAPKLDINDAGELFVEKLFNEGIIGKNSFGVQYKFTPDVSSILLGGFDTSIIANESLFSWINLKSTSHWTVHLKGLKVGNSSISIEASSAILDTGTSFTLFITDDFNKIYSKVTEGKT